METDSSLSSDYWDTNTSQKKQGVGNEKGAPGAGGLTTKQFQSGPPAGSDPTICAENPNTNNGLPLFDQLSVTEVMTLIDEAYGDR